MTTETDAFLDPDTETAAFLDPDGGAPALNVSGQPKPEYEWWGKQNRGYLVTDPSTGQYRTYPQYKNGRKKGWTRVTTFNKAASDSKALNDWGKRNVLLGAARAPKIVDQAYGKTHEDAKELNRWVAELEEIAGAKNSADHGTTVHELTERWDGGELTDLSSIAPRYRETLELYQAELDRLRLRPVRGLIERTTAVLDFGGVAGTLDRVYLHEPSGKYIIGDVKTGKTLEYAKHETECQLAIYANGLNRWGVFNWNTCEWEPALNPAILDDPVSVSPAWGVVIHLPMQGEHAGTCRGLRMDLAAGWEHAQLCYDVRSKRDLLGDPPLWDGTELVAAQDWDLEFRSVRTSEDASRLWNEARAAGVEPLELQRLVSIAREILRFL